jgi:alpha-tubulin suppressor-like RCC1 family protein
VRRTDATVWCWGSNFSGALGTGTRTDSNRAVQVVSATGPLRDVVDIQVDGSAIFSCAQRSDQTVWCWGYAVQGQIGDGTQGDPDNGLRVSPTRVVFAP